MIRVYYLIILLSISFDHMHMSSSRQILILELLVDDSLSESGSGPLHPGDEVAELLDSLDLLLEVLALQEVGQLVVARVVRGLVEVEQGLEKKEKMLF